MFERFTDRARRVVVLAQEEARSLNHNYIGTEHLLLAMIHEGEGIAARALASAGITRDAVRQQVERIIGLGVQAPSGHIPFTPRAKKALERSLPEALSLGDNHIGTEHILLGLLHIADGVAAQILATLGADSNRIRQRAIDLVREYKAKAAALPPAAVSGAEAGAGSNDEPAMFTIPGGIGRNLTQAARAGRLDPAIGREKQIERVIQVLARRTLGNPILVGEPGVGKTALVEGVARKIAQGNVPPSVRGKQIYEIDMEALPDIVSPGELTERLQGVLTEVRARGDVILFLDGLRELTIEVWVILRPMLAQDSLQIIGALTPQEHQDLLDANPALQRVLVPIGVAEPTVSLTVEILKGLRDRYEAHHRVSISNAALVAAAELADKRLPGRRLPGKAIDLIDEAASLCRMRQSAEPPELLEYNEKIAQVRRDKESAIDAQDFEKAKALRGTEKQLLADKAERERFWRDDMDVVHEVDENLVAETISIMLGLPSDDTADGQQATASAQEPPFPPAAMTDDDREIWAIA